MNSFKDYANSFQAVSKLELKGVWLLANKVGSPQQDLQFIHVAGTNGKGSVCAFLQSILSASGLKTGKFISPNMLDVCERISVDGKKITSAEMDLLMTRLQTASAQVYEETGKMPTQFEIWTVAAFMYFKAVSCDIVVLETGLGGRLDATNIIDKPRFSLITRIDMDHMEYLGNTLEQISFEKAGIIKNGCPVISARQFPQALTVLQNVASQRDCKFIQAAETTNNTHEGFSEIFDYKALKKLCSSLCGLHQTENAALAVECAMQLGIDEKYIRLGLEKAQNPGRLEIISKNPTVIFDGAHNASGVKTLAAAIRRYFPDSKLSFIYGAMADKDLKSVLEVFSENNFDQCPFFTVQVENNPRAQTAQRLAQAFTDAGFNATACESFANSYEKAVSKNTVTVICGSLYLYKDMIAYLNDKKTDLLYKQIVRLCKSIAIQIDYNIKQCN